MAVVTTRVLKDQLSGYLHRAEQGEQVIVTRSGKPVAALVPIDQVDPEDEQAILADLARRGLVRLPETEKLLAIPKRRLPGRGLSAAEMVTQDRREL